MDRTFGSVADTAPEGFLARRVHFTTLVRLDEPTKEGILSRTIESAGFGTRELPVAMTGIGPGRGHDGAEPAGRLDMVKISGSNVEGWGWLLDDAVGRQVFKELALGVVRGNSIEMTDVRYKMSFDWPEDADMPQIDVVFTESNVGATTFVMKPAFKDAKGVLEDEITAALAIEGDLEVSASFEVVTEHDEVLTAASAIELSHDAFTVPEPETYQPFQTSRDGRSVSGHLGRWGEPHTGFIDRKVLIPRSRTNYASFCKRRFPTDKGYVYTGPIVLLGGHERTAEVINKALADPQSAWVDVAVVDGKIGPWVCGVVRPHISDAALHIGTGSGISGHWLNGELYAICSVSAEGFDVPRPTAYIVEAYEQDGDEYLAASFTMTVVDGQPEPPAFDPAVYDSVIAAARAALEEDDACDHETPVPAEV